jgi:hypothetical protein
MLHIRLRVELRYNMRTDCAHALTGQPPPRPAAGA